MDYAIIKLKHSLNEISNRKFFKKFFIRKKIHESKKSLKETILNKQIYNALDIISFVNCLKMMNILGYDIIDNNISFTYSNKNISNDIDFAILSFNMEYNKDSSLKIVYKAKIENQLDSIGSIDIEYTSTSIDNSTYYQDKVDRSTRYTITTKKIDKNDTQSTLEILRLSYEILHDIFLIYIEKIFDVIEKEYINEN